MSGEANIYLIGARASGKTTLGRRLAARLKRPFVDTDRRLRVQTGRTVAEIVAEGGWEAFREAEAVVLAQVAMFSGQIVSCGGGVVLRQENRDLLKLGVVLYLKADEEVLAARLTKNPEAAQRPSLTGAGVVEEIRQVLAERGALYLSCAHAVLPADAPLAELEALALAEITRLGGMRRAVAPVARIS